MKKHKKSNLSASFQTLGIICLIFFAMAFSCVDDDSPPPDDQGGLSGETENNRGFCTTEREFKAFIIHDKTFLARNYEEKRVFFHSFKSEGPMRYQNLQDRFSTVTDKAYRVTTDFDVITRGDSMQTNKIYRDRYENVVFMCYRVMWSDGENCVCYGEKNALPVTNSEEITEEDF